MKVSELPPIRKGKTRIICLIDVANTFAINSERNVQYRFEEDLMRDAMQKLSEHFQLCDTIDRFKEDNPYR